MSTALDTHSRMTRPAQHARLVALIAAHNEEHRIAAALESLASQTRKPDEVIVVADRCTDRTADIAVSHGAKVFQTFGNRYRIQVRFELINVFNRHYYSNPVTNIDSARNTVYSCLAPACPAMNGSVARPPAIITTAYLASVCVRAISSRRMTSSGE